MQITTGELAALLADAREAGRDEMPQAATSRAAAARHAEQFRQQLGPRLRELRADIVAAGEPLLDWEGLEREKAARRRQTPETDTSCDCEALRARVKELEADRETLRTTWQAERAQVARDVEVLREDAALGRLVRAMPRGRSLYHGLSDVWEVQNFNEMHARKSSPEEALRAAGVAATDRACGAGE